MKKTIKKSFIAVCSLAFAMSVGVGLNAISASAETVSVEGNFEMVDGASIRVKGNAAPSGIRWSATVTQDYYNYITDIDANAEFGMFVDNTAILDEATNTTEKPIKCTVTPTFENGVWTYYASITYNELQAQLEKLYENDEDKESKIADALKACYETELWARAYVKYTANSVEMYKYAVEADVNRSIKGVAMNCLIQENTTGNADVTDDNKTAFVNYAGGNYETIDSETVTKNAYNLTSATGIITSQGDLEAGDYAVYVGAKKISDKVTHAGGTISATIAGLGSTIAVKGEENNVRFINEEGEVYQVPFVSATHLISTFDGLKSYLDYAVTEDAKNSYAVLTTNIEGNSNSLTGRGANEHYYGTLDGLGYSISDVVAASRSGVFGGYIDGTIKNVAFDNLTTSNTSEDSNHGLFGIYLNKTASVNNVYVKATVSKPKMYRGLFRYNNPACQVSNIVADITYSDDNSAETTYVYGDSANDGWDAWYGNQLYAIGNADKQGGAGNNPVYATSEAFFNAEKANITAEKGFNDYWSKDGYSLSFGDTVIATAAKETKDAWYKTADFEVNLSSLLDGDTPEKMYVNGVETAIPAGNVYAVDWDALTKGEVNQVEVWGNGKIVVQPYMAVTHAIGNAEDMKAFLESYATTDSYATTGTESDGWYVVLTADFDMDGYVHNINYGGGTTWSGTFNGLGHTVSNIEVRQGGLFGRLGVGAVIENVAFVGIKHIKDWYVLCNQAAGNATIRNLYFEGETTNGEAILIRGSKSGMTVSNVIMNFTNNGTKTNVSVFEEKATLKNLYGIGDFDKIKYSGSATGATLYGTVTEFFDKEQANITAENGWNEYWKIQEGGLYFGNTKVE